MRYVDSRAVNKNVFILCLNVSSEMSQSKFSGKTAPCPRSLCFENAVAVICPGTWDSQLDAVYSRSNEMKNI